VKAYVRSVLGLLMVGNALACRSVSAVSTPDGVAGASGGSSGRQGGRGGVGNAGNGGASVSAGNGGASGSAGNSRLDAAGTDAGFAAEFTDRVRAVVAQGGTASTCASPLPIVPVSSRDEAEAAMRAFVAEVLGVAAADLSMTTVDCGTATTQTCAGRFQHDIYKSNGIYGEMLYPLAQDLEARGTFVEETIWVATVDGSSTPAEVGISGIVDGLLVGVVMFNDRQSCP
jgi:hypothetical protein